MKISKVFARQIIDSRATPTIEVDLYFEGGFGKAAVPSGASTGTHEALELRDGDKSNYLGKSVLKAVENVNSTISNAIVGKMFDTQESIDSFLIQLDGTDNKSNLGANAILGVSIAFAHAMADQKKVPLFKYINEIFGSPEIKLPTPMFNIMNGGKHANWSTDIQEFMIIIPNRKYSEQLRASCEIFLNLEKVLKEKGLSTNIGNEGGFAPGFANNEDAFANISLAIEKAGYKLGQDVFFALDIASTEFYNPETQTYTLKTENRELTAEEWLNTLLSWTEKYPFMSIEDPFAEDDWANWSKFAAINGKFQIVGDDLLVTNTARIKRAIEEKSCTSLLVKMNQIGTITETLNAMRSAKNASWTNVASHRSGETEDVTISHLAVGTGCGQIKTGAPSRGERTAKYNELLRIEELV